VPYVPEDRADDANGGRRPYDAALATNPDLLVYRISGAFFFGAASTVGAVLDRIADRPKTFILDFSAVPFLDSTAANTIEGVARKAQRNGVTLILTGTPKHVRHVLWTHGVHPPLVRYKRSVDAALEEIRTPAGATLPAEA
jgi:SulP family sulfate permease